MPLFLAGAVAGLLSFFGVGKAVDNATKPPASTLANPSLPYYITVPLILGGTIGVVMLIKKAIK